jgi:hypothetical protein
MLPLNLTTGNDSLPVGGVLHQNFCHDQRSPHVQLLQIAQQQNNGAAALVFGTFLGETREASSKN